VRNPADERGPVLDALEPVPDDGADVGVEVVPDQDDRGVQLAVRGGDQADPHWRPPPVAEILQSEAA
jgi:hypothetical protein